MIYIYRTRRLVKIVENETDHPTDPLHTRGAPYVNYCLFRFQELSKKYTPEVSKKVLAQAVRKDFLAIDNSEGSSFGKQRVAVTGLGLTLSTPTGFIDELGGAVGRVSSIGSWVISLLALGVSIWVATQS